MSSPHLRVTARCLEDDLRLDSDNLYADAREYRSEHEAVEKLVSMRGETPSEGEPVGGISPRGLVCSLHVGSARGVTTWDPDEDVCWLLAFHTYHKIGDPKDCYVYFLALHASDKLLPTEKDYEALFASLDEQEDAVSTETVERFQEIGQELLAEARATPSREAIRTFTVGGSQTVCVDLVVEADVQLEEGWMGLKLPEDVHLSPLAVWEIVAALLPDDVEPIWSATFRDRSAMPGEVVYKWEHYSEVSVQDDAS